MTITPTRPARQLTRDEAKVLAHYAAGEASKTICINTGFDMTFVGRVLDEHAGNDRARAHQLVLEYTERAQAVAAARGVSGPPAPAAAKASPAAKTTAPTASAPPATTPENTAAGNTGPQSAGPEPVDELEALLQAADATGVPRLQRAATKIRDLAAELRTDLAEHTREAKLRAEQAELEARLAAIKEQLRPRRTQPVLPAAGDGEAPLDTKAVRAWAEKQGLDCPARGRIPGAVTDAYRQAVTGK
jgi:Lsr2